MIAFLIWSEHSNQAESHSRCICGTVHRRTGYLLFAFARNFPFPEDVRLDPPARTIKSNRAELVTNDAHGAFSLLMKQREIIRILVQGRSEYHRNLRNKNKRVKTFSIADLVLARKDVKTFANEGLTRKMQLQARGPYRVLELLNQNTYMFQKLLLEEEDGRPGTLYKESVGCGGRLARSRVQKAELMDVDTSAIGQVIPSSWERLTLQHSTAGTV